jgi:hypothetical protein
MIIVPNNLSRVTLGLLLIFILYDWKVIINLTIYLKVFYSEFSHRIFVICTNNLNVFWDIYHNTNMGASSWKTFHFTFQISLKIGQGQVVNIHSHWCFLEWSLLVAKLGFLKVKSRLSDPDLIYGWILYDFYK